MAVVKTSMPTCQINRHCSDWARTYLKFCLCTATDKASLTLGMISVISWGMAEIPQIVTNYREKSTEGLSAAFLVTWIIGDYFNLLGCILEPATLPTQFYTALLYTMTTMILAIQTVYYGHIYPYLKRKKQHKSEQINDEARMKRGNSIDRLRIDPETMGVNISNFPIPISTYPHIYSPESEIYYKSARSLSSRHTPTAGSYLTQKLANSEIFNSLHSIEEPLLYEEDHLAQSPPAKCIKPTLCLVPTFLFVGALIVHNSAYDSGSMGFDKTNQGFVMQVGRKLMQVGGDLVQDNGNEGSFFGIGALLGWGMAAIYMGGRLPQILLNIKRGNVEGLSPFMFIFALIGNSTYVASILIKSFTWSSIKPNLPWLVDAAGCVLLDTFILLQFFYFHYQSRKYKQGSSDLLC